MRACIAMWNIFIFTICSTLSCTQYDTKASRNRWTTLHCHTKCTFFYNRWEICFASDATTTVIQASDAKHTHRIAERNQTAKKDTLDFFPNRKHQQGRGWTIWRIVYKWIYVLHIKLAFACAYEFLLRMEKIDCRKRQHKETKNPEQKKEKQISCL